MASTNAVKPTQPASAAARITKPGRVNHQAMTPISRGFHGRRNPDVDPSRVPPGQYLVQDFPVLSAGPTPRTTLADWSFTLDGAVGRRARGAGRSSRPCRQRRSPSTSTASPSGRSSTPRWTGVSDRHAAGGRRDRGPVRARPGRDGGYTTNLPLADLTGGKAWIAYDYDGEPLEPEHGGPARLLVPHLYFWKSAKWVRGLTLHDRRSARLLGGGSATTTAAIHGASSATGATEPRPQRDPSWRTADRGRCPGETARASTLGSRCPTGRATVAASTSTCG